MSYAPSPEARAIAAASLRGSLVGASLVMVGLMALAIANGGPFSVGDFRTLPIFVLLFFVVLGAGIIFIGFCLLAFGAVIARLSRSWLESWAGLTIAVASAFAVSVAIGIWFAPSAIAAILAFALPAAILYRKEILIERLFD